MNNSKIALNLIATSICICVAFAMPLAAKADNTKCGARTEIIQLLETQYAEGRVAVALSQKNTAAFEVFVSKRGTWTIMMTTTEGTTCIMAAGHSWETVNEKIAEQQS